MFYKGTTMTRQFQILVSGVSLNCLLISLKSTMGTMHTRTHTHTIFTFIFTNCGSQSCHKAERLQPRS